MEFHPQQAASVLPKSHPQLPLVPQGLLFLYTSDVNKLMFYTNLKMPAPYLSLPNSHPVPFSSRPSSSRSTPPHLFSVRNSFSECRLVEFGVQTPSSDESPGAAEGPFTWSLPPPPPSPPYAPFALVQ